MGEVLENIRPIRDESIGGWNKIPIDAHNECDGSLDFHLLSNYCAEGDCKKGPYYWEVMLLKWQYSGS